MNLQVLDDLPALTLEALYREVRDEMVSAAEKKSLHYSGSSELVEQRRPKPEKDSDPYGKPSSVGKKGKTKKERKTKKNKKNKGEGSDDESSSDTDDSSNNEKATDLIWKPKS
ncbi:hypothetical protein V9T40_011981 [Parthenolecanium corni]|uniref:Uncharacterized protein n=1 Tax=Parthenolecanium corni TaxID=536013 RepID=A0AAN9T8R2_9HEMI